MEMSFAANRIAFKWYDVVVEGITFFARKHEADTMNWTELDSRAFILFFFYFIITPFLAWYTYMCTGTLNNVENPKFW